MRNNTTNRLASAMKMDENEVAYLLKAFLDEASDESVEWLSGMLLKMSLDTTTDLLAKGKSHKASDEISETLKMFNLMNGWNK